MNLRVLGVLVSCSTSVCAYSQLTEDAVKTICAEFAQRVGVPFAATRATAVRELLPTSGVVQWQISEGEKFFVVDEELRFVRAFSDGEVDRSARRTVGQYYQDPEEAWNRAEAILHAIDPNSVLRRWEIMEANSIPGRRHTVRGFVGFTFSQTAYGYNSAGVGNYVSILLESSSGRIATMTCNKGWSYDRPRVVLSAAAAGNRARSLLTDLDPSLLSSIRQTNAQFISPIRGFGCQNYQMYRAQRRIRYGYVIEFDRCQVFIDAETGESLGGIRYERQGQ